MRIHLENKALIALHEEVLQIAMMMTANVDVAFKSN